MKRLPEMLLRWTVFEDLFREILDPIKSLQRDNMCIPPEVWEEAVRRIDQGVAAATCRGDHIEDTDDSTMDLIWDRFNVMAKRKYPNDERVQNL